jgi:hypothetical protein
MFTAGILTDRHVRTLTQITLPAAADTAAAKMPVGNWPQATASVYSDTQCCAVAANRSAHESLQRPQHTPHQDSMQRQSRLLTTPTHTLPRQLDSCTNVPS